MQANPRIQLNLEMLVFEGRGKPENPKKNLSEQGREQEQTQPTCDAGSGSRTRDTLMGGERCHHCAIPATLVLFAAKKITIIVSFRF